MKQPIKRENFTPEELEKISDPLYFYNNYVRKKEDPELSYEEYYGHVVKVEDTRNLRISMPDFYAQYPLTEKEAFK